MQREDDFEGWRLMARTFLQKGIAPNDIDWRMAGDMPLLFGETLEAADIDGFSKAKITVPAAFIDFAKKVICHRDPQRFARLYIILWRLQRERGLLSNRLDDDIAWLHACRRNIGRDVHKMHAFVRFKKIAIDVDGKEAFVAWFEPDHYITRLTANFFMRRFYGMDWAIITPHARAIWRQEKLSFGLGGTRREVPEHDVVDNEWRAYYSAIFNPARVKVKAMCSEMPKKYWKNLPEADQIRPLLTDAPEREKRMREQMIQAANPKARKWQQTLIGNANETEIPDQTIEG